MKRVLITGGNGFLGSAVVEEFQRNAPWASDIITFRSRDYDLRQQNEVAALLNDKRPDVVVHLAATVGGIGANMKHPGRFFYENMVMGLHLLEQSRLTKVGKFVLIGTICSYPKFTPVPFKETDLWNGYPEETNAPYGIAKKALMIQLDAYRREYGMNGISLLPVNLYGPRDNFDLESSHVIPAMIRKFVMAKELGLESVTLWGNGTPSREFLFVDDAARAIRMATESYSDPEPVNLGSGIEISMQKLAGMIKNLVEFEGEIIWDASKPNGQPRRCLDVSRAQQAFGFRSNITLPMGLRLSYDWFMANKAQIEANERGAVEEVQASS